jgi:hypothetical protein
MLESKKAIDYQWLFHFRMWRRDRDLNPRTG